jgi:hypothetical protein
MEQINGDNKSIMICEVCGRPAHITKVVRDIYRFESLCKLCYIYFFLKTKGREKYLEYWLTDEELELFKKNGLEKMKKIIANAQAFD